MISSCAGSSDWVLGSRVQGLWDGTQLRVCDSGVLAHGLWSIVYGLCFIIYGLWFKAYDLKFLVYGLWFMVYGL